MFCMFVDYLGLDVLANKGISIVAMSCGKAIVPLSLSGLGRLRRRTVHDGRS